MSHPNEKTTPEAFRKAMEGLTNTQAGTVLLVSERHVSRLRSGKHTPRRWMLDALKAAPRTGNHKPAEWTLEEDTALRARWGEPIAAIGRELGRGRDAVRRRARALGLDSSRRAV